MMEPELRPQFIKQKVTHLLWLLVKAVSVSVGVTVAVSRLGCIGWRTKTLWQTIGTHKVMRHRLRQSALSDAQVAHEEENVI